jgi:predicted ATP-dependent Lon-type protease
MHELRKESFSYNISKRLILSAEGDDVNIRDQKAIQRVCSGIMKLLSPHNSNDPDALEIAAKIAVEYRQKIHDWLCLLSPGEFHPKTIRFQIKDL